MALAAGGSDASASRSPESTCSGSVCSCEGSSFAPCTACGACEQGVVEVRLMSTPPSDAALPC